MSQRFKKGDICRGVVFDVAEFGVFIKIDQCVGFVNITEITWANFARVSEVMQMGQDVVAVVIGVDPAREQLILSTKALHEDPLKKFAREEFGRSIVGSVVKLTPIGIFVSLIDGLAGLIPKSGPIGDSVNFRVGEEVVVEVTGINFDSRQIMLSPCG
ncbi:S1 RNA-binding domain-containing protein [Streptomyces griseus]|uniref:S1 RNA-binding domain-containing protein n=1 Tax=Streptomyces griseus TaxID=1911 RepID=UPI0033F7E4ED